MATPAQTPQTFLGALKKCICPHLLRIMFAVLTII
jgi:hypothetical protein